MDDREGTALGTGDDGELDAELVEEQKRPERSGRQAWCMRLAALAQRFMDSDRKDDADERMPEGEALELAALVWDLGDRHGHKNTRFGDHPAELLMAYQLEQQGVSGVAALVTAKTMLSVDMNKLIVTTVEACKIIGVSRPTLTRQVEIGRMRPAARITKGERDRLFCFWLADILWVKGWRRTNPRLPGPYSWYPEPAAGDRRNLATTG